MLTRITIAVFAITLLGLVGVTWAQEAGECPKIELGGPRGHGKYFGRGEIYLITVVASPVGRDTEIRANWELSPSIPYREIDDSTVMNPNSGARYISFVATPDLRNVTVNVSVRIDGLPPACPNTKTTSFKVQYNDESPREIARTPRNDRRFEEGNYYELTFTLREADGSVIALIVVNYSKSDTKTKLREYVERVSALLTDKFSFAREKFSFAFNEKNDEMVVAYGWPTEKQHSWETDVEKLPIPD